MPVLRPRLHGRRDGGAARPDRRPAGPQPLPDRHRVLPPHPLDQARWRAQEHDGQGHHAPHAPRRADRLPPPLHRKTPPARPITFTQATDPTLFVPPNSLEALRPLRFVTVTGTAASRQWNEYIARYHYLGYKRLVGAQMRYAVEDDRTGLPLAMLGFSTAAWKIAPRDRLIGWTPRTRENNLPLVVNNSRLLILPWASVPNLASHILSIVRRRLPEDWRRQYAIDPVLIETIVETPRFTGATYRASGWIHVGTTQGRGRYDTKRQYALPKKHIWLCPLRRDWKRTLNS